MKKVLIISRQPFGYIVDITKWCSYLDNEYSIDVVTLEGKHKFKVKRDNLHIHYVSAKGNRSVRGLRFILTCLWHIIRFKGAIIVEYFTGCNIFKKILPWKKIIMDIRTLSVSDNEEIRKRDDKILKQYTKIFDFVTIISEGTREKLGLDKSKSAIVPLGADIISKNNKKFNDLRLLYVGTLTGRKMDKTIKGLAMFIKNNPTLDIHYDIVGDGLNNELQDLKNLATKLGINRYVTFHGFKQHNEITHLFNNCNIGISFVPITPHYDHQPPTKSYEYVLSGLYTIATETFCNKEIITENNGMLIKDNEESFCFALEQILANRDKFDSEKIRKTLMASQWENIVKETLQKVIEDVTYK